jgi:hypothetical protein
MSVTVRAIVCADVSCVKKTNECKLKLADWLTPMSKCGFGNTNLLYVSYRNDSSVSRVHMRIRPLS